MRMTKRPFARFAAVAAVLFALLLPSIAGAAQSADLLEQTVTPDSIILYVRGAEQTNADALIGADSILGVEVDGLDGDVPTITWLLVDNSLSISKNDRKLTARLLEDVIADRGKNERFVLCTISEHLEPLIFDSSDYVELKTAIEEVEYRNQETYLTDTLSELLDLLAQRGDEEFTRVLVVSDGVDNNPGGITRTELERRLEERRLPVYSVGCKGDAKELKEMYALSRQTGARYWAFSETDDTRVISSAMRYEELPARVTIPIPDALCDGMEKGVQVDFGGGNIIRTQVQMPFGGVTPAPVPQPEPEREPDPEPEPEPEREPEPEPTLADKLREHWLAVVLLALCLILLLPVLFALPKRKKADGGTPSVKSAKTAKAGKSGKKAKGAPNAAAEKAAAAPSAFSEYPDFASESKTIHAGTAGWSDATIYAKAGVPEKKKVTLRLQDLTRAEMRFEMLLPAASGLRKDSSTISFANNQAFAPLDPDSDALCIGRAPSNDIAIDYDRTVSGRHCRLVIKNGVIRVYDLGSKNGTFVNGMQVKGDEPIIAASGSTLELGDVSFRVELDNR
ncbi:MAG: FHA domain-containing protein [Oscillospiraceae bacterium]|nr:FHA domain-containing protein [Oscillospiraceae bacterium]